MLFCSCLGLGSLAGLPALLGLLDSSAKGHFPYGLAIEVDFDQADKPYMNADQTAPCPRFPSFEAFWPQKLGKSAQLELEAWYWEQIAKFNQDPELKYYLKREYISYCIQGTLAGPPYCLVRSPSRV